MTYGQEPFLSKAYAAAEGGRLWSKVWQNACRVEELPNVGDFVTYDIHHDSIIRTGRGDARISTATMQREIWETVNARTTETLVKAAERLVDELPEGTPPDKVMAHWLESAKRDDSACCASSCPRKAAPPSAASPTTPARSTLKFAEVCTL